MGAYSNKYGSSYRVRSWCSLSKEQDEVFHDIAEKRRGMSTINYKCHVDHNAPTLPPSSPPPPTHHPPAPALYSSTLSLLNYGQWCVYWRKFSNFILLLKYWKILSEDMRPCKSQGIHDVTGWMGFLSLILRRPRLFAVPFASLPLCLRIRLGIPTYTEVYNDWKTS